MYRLKRDKKQWDVWSAYFIATTVFCGKKVKLVTMLLKIKLMIVLDLTKEVNELKCLLGK